MQLLEDGIGRETALEDRAIGLFLSTRRVRRVSLLLVSHNALGGRDMAGWVVWYRCSGPRIAQIGNSTMTNTAIDGVNLATTFRLRY